MKKIAITGGIGSGKSTVSSYLREKGFFVADADALSKKVLEKGSFLVEKFSGLFGAEILNEDKSLNRQKMADIIFSDKEKYDLYSKTVQAAIWQEMEKSFELKEKEGLKLVFAEVPLLFEASWQDRFDKSLLVCASKKVRIERVMKRSKLTKEQVEERINHQMQQEEKEKLADFIIENETDLESLKKQIDKLLEKM